MTLQSNWELRNNSALRNRVTSAIAKAAEDVRNEAASTVHHAERIIWAITTIGSVQGPQSEANRAMWMMVQNATIQTGGEESTDNDIQFVVNGLIDFLAGVDTSI